MNTQFCDGQGNCGGYLPGTKGAHQYLHDHVGAYRAWHHSGIRVPVHVLVAFLTLLLAGAVALGPRLADNPQAATGIFAQLPFQGRLTNSDGTVVADGSYDAVLRLYTTSIGGAAVWTESHTGANQISAVDGIFSTTLGALTSLTGIDFNLDEYWLGVTVGTDAEMTPRIRLGAAPYAFNSDELDGVSAENFFQLPGQAGGQTGYGGTAASQNLVLRSTSHATKGDILLVDDGGDVRVGTLGNASLSVPGTSAGTSEQFGLGASATGFTNTAVGSAAAASATSTTALGYGTVASSTEALAVGMLAKATGLFSTALGARAEVSGLHSIALGDRTVADEDNALVIGDNFEAGYDTSKIYFGYGRVSSFSSNSIASTLQPTGGLGLNHEGMGLKLAGGQGTGSAAGGSVKIQTAPAGASGSSLNALVDRLIVTDEGDVGIGTNDPFDSILGSVAIGGKGIHIETGATAGDVLIEGNDPSFDLVNDTAGAGAKWTEIFQSTAGFLGFFSRDDSGVRIQTTTEPNFSIDNATENVGIGTIGNNFRLEVAGHIGPDADDTYDLGSSALRFRDLYLGPTSLHLTTTVAETATARDWKMTVDETNGATTDGNLRIQEGSSSYFTITTTGSVIVGSAALATTATDGFLYLSSMPGVPTGTPTSYTGRVALAYNSTADDLYVYDGTWEKLNSTKNVDEDVRILRGGVTTGACATTSGTGFTAAPASATACLVTITTPFAGPITVTVSPVAAAPGAPLTAISFSAAPGSFVLESLSSFVPTAGITVNFTVVGP
ncbi:MAG: hypothetical protein AAB701_00560 [Patescibacteria group bacterium]